MIGTKEGLHRKPSFFMPSADGAPQRHIARTALFERFGGEVFPFGRELKPVRGRLPQSKKI